MTIALKRVTWSTEGISGLEIDFSWVKGNKYGSTFIEKGKYVVF